MTPFHRHIIVSTRRFFLWRIRSFKCVARICPRPNLIILLCLLSYLSSPPLVCAFLFLYCFLFQNWKWISYEIFALPIRRFLNTPSLHHAPIPVLSCPVTFFRKSGSQRRSERGPGGCGFVPKSSTHCNLCVPLPPLDSTAPWR